jgi:outer membrane immunogenic protein
MSRTLRFAFPAALALAAAGALSAHAQAPASTAAFNWNGPYVGVTVGENFDGGTHFDRTTGSAANNQTALNLGLRPVAHDVRSNGFVGGGQIGYNFELGHNLGVPFMHGGGLVAGFEADAMYTDLKRTDTLSNTTNYGPLDVLGTTPTTRINQYQSKVDFLGTARGRLGVAFDKAFLYGTGGLAYGQVERSVTYYGPNAPTTPYFAGSNNGMKTGYAYGAGFEVAVPTSGLFSAINPFHTAGATIKAEYLHYDLGSDTLTFPGVNAGAALGSYTTRVRTDGDIVRAGLNYKF